METAACKRTSASKLGADVRVHIGGPPVFFFRDSKPFLFVGKSARLRLCNSQARL